MRNRSAIFIIAGFVLLYGVVWAYYERTRPQRLALQDDVSSLLNRLRPADQSAGAAPDISIFHDGKKVALSDYKGKVVLIDFWATWCGPCRESIPGVVQLYEKYKDRGFQVIGPAMERDKGTVIPRAVEALKMTYPVGLPTAIEPIQAYGADELPMTVLVDKKGMIRWHQKGYVPGMERTVEKFVQQLLAE